MRKTNNIESKRNELPAEPRIMGQAFASTDDHYRRSVLMKASDIKF